jgi:hypothetical protein
MAYAARGGATGTARDPLPLRGRRPRAQRRTSASVRPADGLRPASEGQTIDVVFSTVRLLVALFLVLPNGAFVAAKFAYVRSPT